MIWKRGILLFLLALTGLVLETSVLGVATLDGSKPELLLLMTIALAMNEGPAFGATAGFVLGIATDVFLGLPKGVSALVFTAVGYGVGRARAQMSAPTAWLPIVMVAGATLGGMLAYGGFGMLLGEHVSSRELFRHAALSSAYNALLTPFVFPIVRALGARLRPAGVVR
ncbi:MAG: rod shape-determining protein MreD [Actinomycetota bacterium]|nr:rod shape-determining protein MreD [Actinomycetota bacterium]